MELINLSNYTTKLAGSVLSANEWNTVFTDIQNKLNDALSGVAVASTNISGVKVPESKFYVNGVEKSATNGIVELSVGGKYTLSGSLTGSVKINAASNCDHTYINLDGVNITTSEEYGIGLLGADTLSDCGNLIINVNPGTVNSIKCTTVHSTTTDDDRACIYNQVSNMSVRGIGKLDCTNKSGHGIKASKLTLAGPDFTVNCIHDGFHGGSCIDILCGKFTLDCGKDGFGTGVTDTSKPDKGTIRVFGGKFYGRCTESCFDGKKVVNVYVQPDVNSVVAAKRYNGSSNMIYQHPVTFYGTGQVIYYSEWGKETITETVPVGDNGEYLPVKDVVVTGYINKPIVFTTDTNYATDGGYSVRLQNAYIDVSTIGPAIVWSPDKKSVKVSANTTSTDAGTYNIINCSTTASSTVDADSIKSEGNVKLESKSGCVLYITSKYGDGVDGSEVLVTDSKGSVVVSGCGERGVKATYFEIGPNVENNKGTIVPYVDATDSDNYKTFDGIFAVINNCKNVVESPAVPENGSSVSYKDYGYADIFCRNGKFTKGKFYTKSAQMKGTLIVGSLGAKEDMEFDNCANICVSRVIDANTIENFYRFAKGDYLNN